LIESDSIGVVAIADLHIGAEVSDLVITEDYNDEIIARKLRSIADQVNKLKFKEVHLLFLGDYFESLSGLNHSDTFKSLGRKGHGSGVMEMAAGLLSGMIRSINNVTDVYMVHGNHDRHASRSEDDPMGEGGKMLAFILKLMLQPFNIRVTDGGHLHAVTIDDINYILTHGHHSLSKRVASDLIMTLSDQIDVKKYTLLLEGHRHTRSETKKLGMKSVSVSKDVKIIVEDTRLYSRRILPPIFTGNSFSERLGHTSRSGINIYQNHEKCGEPVIIDCPIPMR
jgi:predicted phosphodiesterase